MQTESEKLRDEGMDRVLESSADEWKASVYNYIRALPDGWTGTGEDIRQACEKSHAPQAWGAIINASVRCGWLQPTGKYQRMKSKSSHARETRIYLRTNVT